MEVSMQIYNINFDHDKKETTQHGTLDFPLAIYTTRINKNILGFIDWHWHQELQFCLVTAGQVEFHINQETIVLTKDEGLFINSKQLHQIKNYQDIDSSYICFDFDSKLISSFSGSIINNKYVEPYVENSAIQYCTFKQEINWQKEIIILLKQIYFEYIKDASNQLTILISLQQIWNHLYTFYFSTLSYQPLINNNQLIKNIINYINCHYFENISLEEIAKIVNLSKSHCCKEFKQAMGCTIFEYIINYRLLQATKLLLTTDNTITEIAYQCGFNSSSYFIKHFKAKTKISPNQYRKKNKTA